MTFALDPNSSLIYHLFKSTSAMAIHYGCFTDDYGNYVVADTGIFTQ